jgi:hypothetical protein
LFVINNAIGLPDHAARGWGDLRVAPHYIESA